MAEQRGWRKDFFFWVLRTYKCGFRAEYYLADIYKSASCGL